jgi:hypothetical protein
MSCVSRFSFSFVCYRTPGLSPCAIALLGYHPSPVLHFFHSARAITLGYRPPLVLSHSGTIALLLCYRTPGLSPCAIALLGYHPSPVLHFFHFARAITLDYRPPPVPVLSHSESIALAPPVLSHSWAIALCYCTPGLSPFSSPPLLPLRSGYRPGLSPSSCAITLRGYRPVLSHSWAIALAIVLAIALGYHPSPVYHFTSATWPLAPLLPFLQLLPSN